jgi:DNA-binding beta-propeller fold protein YncE
MGTLAAPAFREAVGWEQLPSSHTHLDVADVAVDNDDNVYLITRMEPMVMVYDRHGRYLRSWGANAFSARPHALTIGPDQLLYCVDEDEHVVLKFTRDGKPRGVIGTRGMASDTGIDWSISDPIRRHLSITRGGAPFNHPTKVAVAPNGDLYIADGYGNARVHWFSPSGKLIRSWGEPGIGAGEFNVPHSVCVSPDGRVLVADRENDRVQVFTPEGDFLEAWTDVQRPTAIVLDPSGLILITELSWSVGDRSWRNGRIDRELPASLAIVADGGRVLGRIGTAGGPCSPGSFFAPHGLAVDSYGDVYVAEVTCTFGRARQVDVHACPTLRKLERIPV